ncbi:MAG: ABC transporter ATP-binding protein [Halanaerobiales bacterium]
MIINVENLSKYYGNHLAVDNISFNVKKGEIFGFLGPNGAGKSTTINIITGLIKPTSGCCSIFGVNVKNINDDIYRKIGVVFEENNLYKRLTGKQNLEFFADMYQLTDGRSDYLLKMFDLTDAADRQVKNYSKGMKQRLLICRALLHEPELLILDEPTSGLDPTSVEIIHQAIENFISQGKTVFLSTHFMEEAEKLCSRLAFIKEGQIRTVEIPAQLKEKYGEPVLEVKLKYTKSNQKDLAENVKTIIDQIEDSFLINDEIINVKLSLNQKDAGEKLDRLRADFKVLNIHSRDATLRDVFMKIMEN